MTSNKICWYEVNGSKCQCPKCYGCRRKKAFTQQEAQDKAIQMNNNPRRRLAKVKAYDCPWCDDWHVGHDNKLVPLWKQNR
jgi:hypothetical protein